MLRTILEELLLSLEPLLVSCSLNIRVIHQLERGNTCINLLHVHQLVLKFNIQ